MACIRLLTDTAGIDAAILARATSRGLTPFAARLEENEAYYDARLAGYWAWGLSSWIGDAFCRVRPCHSLPSLARTKGVNRQHPHLSDTGAGVNRRVPRLGDRGTGCNRVAQDRRVFLIEWFQALAARLRDVRMCCGDFERILGPAVQFAAGERSCGIVLDPPYSTDCGLDTVYAHHGTSASRRAREWALTHGADPRLRIALCGYDGEHAMPAAWECVPWKAAGGYGSNRKRGENINKYRERIWFSPGCLCPIPD